MLVIGPFLISLRHAGVLVIGLIVAVVFLTFLSADILIALGVIERDSGEQVSEWVTAFYIAPISALAATAGAGIRRLRGG